jgi:hypothetical protein
MERVTEYVNLMNIYEYFRSAIFRRYVMIASCMVTFLSAKRKTERRERNQRDDTISSMGRCLEIEVERLNGFLGRMSKK